MPHRCLMERHSQQARARCRAAQAALDPVQRATCASLLPVAAKGFAPSGRQRGAWRVLSIAVDHVRRARAEIVSIFASSALAKAGRGTAWVLTGLAGRCSALAALTAC